MSRVPVDRATLTLGLLHHATNRFFPVAIFCCLLAILLASSLRAGADSERAHQIAARPEYAGYRVEPGGVTEVESPGGSAVGPHERERRFTREAREAGIKHGGNRMNLPHLSIGGIGNGLFWTLVIGAAVVLVLVISRVIFDSMQRRSQRTTAVKERSESEPQDSDPRGGLERAYLEALGNGDMSAAALLRFRIFWFDAGWKECLSEREVLTWRDSLALIGNDESRARVRELLALVEGVRYGRYRPSRDEYEAWERKLSALELRVS